MTTAVFGHLPCGRAVERLTITNAGLTAHVLTLGAIVQDLRLSGHPHPLVLGSPTLDAYLGPMRYFGAIVGRFANRLRGAHLQIDGTLHHLAANEGSGNCLHGGPDGCHAALWSVAAHERAFVTLTLHQPDGHMGFPGALDITAQLSITDQAALRIALSATCDAPTAVSLAHHGYFTLDGGDCVDHHLLQIAADGYLPTDANQIPTGEIAPVAGTRFDFRRARPIGAQLIDHTFCLARQTVPLRPIAHLQAPGGQVTLRVSSTQTGVQVYNAAHLQATGLSGLDGRRYGPRAGLALETQCWPDSPNQTGFPDAILRPDDRYHQITEYRVIHSQTVSAAQSN
ncbi:aldose epimerase family protein [Sagittula sp. SSi028]|uniref:aldose epimerase family protein n=1 Tax=Sagittula sp. SSi028 TaxID=3400636 RepID=UPI003AF9806D